MAVPPSSVGRDGAPPPVGLPRRTGAPLHHQLSTVLRSAINSGRYGYGQHLPGENRLMEAYGVSRATVRRALLTLEADALIERHQGKGTRVVADGGAVARTPLDEHVRQLEQEAARTSVTVLSLEDVSPPTAVRMALRLTNGDECLRIVRVRSWRDIPLRHMTTYVPAAVASVVSRETWGRVTSVEALRLCEHEVRRAEDEVGASLADAVVAPALAVDVGAPLLDLARVMYDHTQEPVAFQWTLIPPERHRLRLVVTSEEGESIPAAADLSLLAPVSAAGSASLGRAGGAAQR